MKIELIQKEIFNLVKENNKYKEFLIKNIFTINKSKIILSKLINKNLNRQILINQDNKTFNPIMKRNLDSESVQVQSLLMNYFMAVSKTIRLLKKFTKNS